MGHPRTRSRIWHWLRMGKQGKTIKNGKLPENVGELEWGIPVNFELFVRFTNENKKINKYALRRTNNALLAF